MTFQDPWGGRDKDTPPFLPPGSHILCPECQAMPSPGHPADREEGGHGLFEGQGTKERKYQNTKG